MVRVKSTTHPAAQALRPEADKPREVIALRGIQVLDARDRLRVVLRGKPPVGVKTCLRHSGFQPISDGVWEAPHSPSTIFAATDIVKTFFEEPTGC